MCLPINYKLNLFVTERIPSKNKKIRDKIPEEYYKKT
jgi:hypothetical protein